MLSLWEKTGSLRIGLAPNDAAKARLIPYPALIVLGGRSVALSPRFEETFRFPLDQLPNAEGFVLPDTTHFLHLETPATTHRMAEALADF